MAEEFVNKEVFDARMDRMEALLEKTLMEMKADNEKPRGELRADNEKLRSEVNTLRAEVRADINELRGEVRADINDIRGDVHALTAHIQSLEYWGAIIIGAATVAFGLAQYFQSKRETIAAKVRDELNELRKTVLAIVEAGKIAAPR